MRKYYHSHLKEAVDQKLDQFSQHVRDSYDHIRDFRLYSRGDDIHLDRIEVEPSQRKKGVGSSVMKKLAQHADSRGKRITLNLADKGDPGGTSSRGRLSRFYKAHGFVDNKGRNKDYSISASMYRKPDSTSRAGLIREPQSDYETSAKKHFGTTNKPHAAGYILRDGSMLDFSGSKDGGDPNTRSLDHRNIDHADGIPSFDHSHTESMLNFMRKTNAIRLQHTDDYTMVDMGAHPTKHQVKTLRRIVPADVEHELHGASMNFANNTDYGNLISHGRDFHGWLGKMKGSLNKGGVKEDYRADLLVAAKLNEVFSAPRTNRYAGKCSHCEIKVPVNKGKLKQYTGSNKSALYCPSCHNDFSSLHSVAQGQSRWSRKHPHSERNLRIDALRDKLNSAKGSNAGETIGD